MKLRDSILGMVQQEPTPDLMPDTLAALSALMLAQAQETIYIKGHKGTFWGYTLLRAKNLCATTVPHFNSTHPTVHKCAVLPGSSSVPLHAVLICSRRVLEMTQPIP